MQESNGNPIPTKSRQEQLVEAEFGEPVDILLRRLYEEERLTQAAIAQRLGVGHSTVIRWFQKHGIVGRHPREHREAVAS